MNKGLKSLKKYWRLFCGVFVLLLLSTTLLWPQQKESVKPFVVVLDAGHGGKDPGNLGNGFREKDIVLDVTLQVGALLQSEGIEVIYTRKKDVFVELYDRAPIANKADADLFISIHCDAHHSQAYGVGTFVMGLSKSEKNLSTAKKENEVIFLEDNYQERYEGFDPSSPELLIGLTLLQEEYLDQSIRLAGLVQEKLVKTYNRKDRSVKQDVFWVLHHSYMPSVLIELGFLTNNNEGPYLNSKKGRKEMAQGIAQGVLSYKQELDYTRSSPPIEQQITQEGQEPLSNSFNAVAFKVQIAASGKKLALKSYNFNGLEPISREKENELYRYFYGETTQYSVAESLQKEAVKKGFKGAYVVAFKDGERIALEEVLNN